MLFFCIPVIALATILNNNDIIMWSRPIEFGVHDLVIVGDKVIYASDNKIMVVSSQSGDFIWKFSLPTSYNNLYLSDDEVFASTNVINLNNEPSSILFLANQC